MCCGCCCHHTCGVFLWCIVACWMKSCCIQKWCLVYMLCHLWQLQSVLFVAAHLHCSLSLLDFGSVISMRNAICNFADTASAINIPFIRGPKKHPELFSNNSFCFSFSYFIHEFKCCWFVCSRQTLLLFFSCCHLKNQKQIFRRV